MSLFMVDVEADGPYPQPYSMVAFAAVIVDASVLEGVPTSFLAWIRPDGSRFSPEALAACNLSREQTLQFEPPGPALERFAQWLREHSTDGRCIAVSDNPAFDMAYLTRYLHEYAGSSPFGFSARRVGDFYAGLRRDWRAASRWKRLRRTAHTHNPLDDALGNAQALLLMAQEARVKLA
jgi:inhibitor of KinA sporulation pathway (predicted exonuclease)